MSTGRTDGGQHHCLRVSTDAFLQQPAEAAPVITYCQRVPHITFTCKVKVNLDLYSVNTPLRRSGMACIFSVLPAPPLHSSTNGMNHTCLFFLSQSWSSFTDPGGKEGWVGLSVCLSPASNQVTQNDITVYVLCTLYAHYCAFSLLVID